MNQKLLIIIILVVLIVLMAILTLTSNKKKLESFHGSDPNCNNITDLTLCETHFGSRCRINPEDATKCMHKCTFLPSQVFEPDYNKDAADAFHTEFNMNEVDVDGKVSYEFVDEDNLGPLEACKAQCPSVLDGGCLPDDCFINCRRYVEAKVRFNSKENIRYKPYPTNRIPEDKYEEIKQEILSKLDNEEYSSEIQQKLFGNSIDTELTQQADLKERTNTLSKIIEDLNDLKYTGNNFIQQIDQLGAFQDKYSEKIDSVLNEKRNSNTDLDKKLAAMSSKLETLNDLYSNYNVAVDTAEADFKQFYKTGTCLANGLKIFFTPVTYNTGTTTKEELKFFKNGAYLINLENSGSVTDFLFVEPLKLDSNNDTIFCNPHNLDCNYKLTKGTDRDTTTLFKVNATDNIIGKLYPATYSESTKAEFQHKKQAFFNIIEVKNNDDYNSIIIKTPNGNKNLITPSQNIKYPFFVIESIELPGYLVNIIQDDKGGNSLQLIPADKRGTEKFSVDNINTGATNSQCSV